MLRIMALTFLGLGWAFYEASGGAAFTPPDAVPTPRVMRHVTEAPQPVAPEPVQGVWADGPDVVAGPEDFAPGLFAAVAIPAEATVRPTSYDAIPFSAPPAVEAGRGGDVRIVEGRRVNVRTGPGTRYDVLGALDRGETAEVLGKQGGWVQIHARGRTGWIAGNLLSR